MTVDITISEIEYDRLLACEKELLGLKRDAVLKAAAVTAGQVPVGFGDGLRRDPGDSYGRPCGNPACTKSIHKNNTAGVCTSCYMAGYRLVDGIV